VNEILVILFAGLIALDLILVATRSSILNLHLPRLLGLHEHRKADVERTLSLLDRPRVRSSLRLAQVLIHCFYTVVILLIFQTWFKPDTQMWLLLGLTFVVVLIILSSEFALEGKCSRQPEALALSLTPFAYFVDFLCAPFSALFLALLPTLADARQKKGALVTEDDLRVWAKDDQTDGSLQSEERKMIYSIFQFGDTLVREIMVPRIDIHALETTTPLLEAIDSLVQTGHSRIPVFEETIDNIVGILYAKDLLRIWQKGDQQPPIRNIVRPVYFVPEAKKVDELLTEMQNQRIHIAIVVDEYGGGAGLVTLEDILEEIVGEVRDEYDQGEEMLYQQVGPDEYIFQGGIDLDDFNEVMGAHLQKDEADTLGGFIYHQMGKIPVGGESIQKEDITLVVEQVSRRRIQKVRAFHFRLETTSEGKDVDK